MRLNHASLSEYLKSIEPMFLGQSFYAPIALNNETVLFINSDKSHSFLCLSLNPKSPAIYVGKTDNFYSSFNLKFCNQLRALADQFLVVDYEVKPNDFVISLRLAISNNKDEDLLLIFEIFPNHPNVIVTDLDYTIRFAFRHDKNRSLNHGEKYDFPVNEKLVDGDIKIDTNFVREHFENELAIRLQEKYADFIQNYRVKIKKCRTKINNIQNDVNKAKIQQNYQQIADNLLCLGLDLKQHLSSVEVDGKTIDLDSAKTVSENIQNMYKRAKKAAQTIKLANENIERANSEIKLYENIIDKLQQSKSEKEADKVVSAYSFKRKHETVTTEFNLPWRINLNGTYIYFGKNASQNDYLSFVMKMNRQFIWFHISELSGSHIVIASEKPTDNEILFAAELALYQSKQKAGQIAYTQKKNVRRGHTLGEAIVKNYKTIKLNSIREESIQKFLSAERCH